MHKIKAFKLIDNTWFLFILTQNCLKTLNPRISYLTPPIFFYITLLQSRLPS